MEDDRNKSDEDLMRDAFQALLRGDTAERDRIVERIEARQKERQQEDVKIATAAQPYFTKH